MVLPAPLEWVKLFPHSLRTWMVLPAFTVHSQGDSATERVVTKKAQQSFTNHPTLSTDSELILLEVFPEAI